MSLGEFSLLVRGVPAHSLHHGALGWCSVGLIRLGSRICLLDTGGFGYRGMLLESLTAEGLSPREVTDILVTHSHWDHLTNIDLFPHAVVRISESELAWALSLPEDDALVPVAVLASAMARGRISVFRPGEEVFAGVSAVPTPGHTPGHTSFVVRTASGSAIFAGDAIKNEVELVTREARMTMDASESSRSIARLIKISQMDSAPIYCGHDRVFHWQESSFLPGEAHPAAIGIVEFGQDRDAPEDRLVEVVESPKSLRRS